jgi:hypothetical protein
MIGEILEMSRKMDELEAENAKLRKELETAKAYLAYPCEGCERLRAAVDAAQKLLNEVHCYSTGIALMAEPDMAQLFGEFTEAQEQLADVSHSVQTSPDVQDERRSAHTEIELREIPPEGGRPRRPYSK